MNTSNPYVVCGIRHDNRISEHVQTFDSHAKAIDGLRALTSNSRDYYHRYYVCPLSDVYDVLDYRADDVPEPPESATVYPPGAWDYDAWLAVDPSGTMWEFVGGEWTAVAESVAHAIRDSVVHPPRMLGPSDITRIRILYVDEIGEVSDGYTDEFRQSVLTSMANGDRFAWISYRVEVTIAGVTGTSSGLGRVHLPGVSAEPALREECREELQHAVDDALAKLRAAGWNAVGWATSIAEAADVSRACIVLEV